MHEPCGDVEPFKVWHQQPNSLLTVVGDFKGGNRLRLSALYRDLRMIQEHHASIKENLTFCTKEFT